MKPDFNYHLKPEGMIFLINHGLSKREIEVVQSCVRFTRLKSVASDLSIIDKTVKFHLTSIYKKLGFKSKQELVLRMLPYFSQEPTVIPDVILSTSDASLQSQQISS